MKQLSYCIADIVASFGEEGKKLAGAASNNVLFKKAVKEVWQSDDAANLILAHTNAFYVREDETVRMKRRAGSSTGNQAVDASQDSSSSEGSLASGARPKFIACEICVDDSMVMSELDTHREHLEIALRSKGLSFNEIRLIHSRGDMRTRHPFGETSSL